MYIKITKLVFYLVVFIGIVIISYSLSTCSDSNIEETSGGAFDGENHEPTTFSLISGSGLGGVSDGATDVSITPQLAWTESKTYNTGDRILYEIYIDTVNPPVKRINGDISGTSYTVTLADALQNGRMYYFMVIAKDNDGDRTESNVFSFTAIDGADFMLLTADTINLTNNPFPLVSVRPTLTWEEPAAVTSPKTNASRTNGQFTYIVYIDTVSPPIDVRTDTVTQTRYTLTEDLNALDTFFWQVAAITANNDTLISGISKFKTGEIPDNLPPTSFSLTSPLDAATAVSRTPTLSWDASTDPDGEDTNIMYLVYVGENDPPTNQLSDTVTQNSYEIDDADRLELDKQYFWRIAAVDEAGDTTFSNTWSFTTIGTLPTPFSLTSPTDDTTDVSKTPTLSWEVSTDPDGDDTKIKYIVYLGENNPPTDADIMTDTVTQTSYTILDVDILESSTVYYWRIAAVDESDDTTFSSNTWSFTTLNIPPTAPNLFLPPDDTKEYQRVPVFGWLASTDPDGDDTKIHYSVYVGKNDPPTNLIKDSVTAGLFGLFYSFDEADKLDPGTKYYWRIAAVDEDGATTFSSTRSFTTFYFPAVTLLTPSAGETLLTFPVLFSWNKHGLSGVVYELYYKKGGNPDPAVDEVQHDFGENDTTYRLELSELELGSTYYWQVLAVHENDPSLYAFSSVGSFSIGNTIQTKPNPHLWVKGDDFDEVTGADGSTWMDRNLGANMAADENKQAMSSGSYFQFGRKADGHEIVEIDLSNSDFRKSISLVNGFEQNLLTAYNTTDDKFRLRSLNDTVFIGAAGSATPSINSQQTDPAKNNWYQGSVQAHLWKKDAANNNDPCPNGYRIPSYQELHDATGSEFYDQANPLKLTKTGIMFFPNAPLIHPEESLLYVYENATTNDTVFYATVSMRYLVSNPNYTVGRLLQATPLFALPDADEFFSVPKKTAAQVRCIKK